MIKKYSTWVICVLVLSILIPSIAFAAAPKAIPCDYYSDNHCRFTPKMTTMKHELDSGGRCMITTKKITECKCGLRKTTTSTSHHVTGSSACRNMGF